MDEDTRCIVAATLAAALLRNQTEIGIRNAVSLFLEVELLLRITGLSQQAPAGGPLKL